MRSLARLSPVAESSGLIVIAIVTTGFVASYRILKRDEAIDTAHALALHDLSREVRTH